MASLDKLVERHERETSGDKWRTTAGPFYMRRWLYHLGFHWMEEWSLLKRYPGQGSDWGDPVRKQLRWTLIPLTPWMAGRAKCRGPAHNTGSEPTDG